MADAGPYFAEPTRLGRVLHPCPGYVGIPGVMPACHRIWLRYPALYGNQDALCVGILFVCVCKNGCHVSCRGRVGRIPR